MKNLNTLFAAILCCSALSPEIVRAEATFPDSLGKHDFFVKTVKPSSLKSPHLSFNSLTAPASLNQCRENIAKVICLVDPALPGQGPEDRKCLPGGQAYAHLFEELFDNYPKSLQKVFCSLRFIFIENKLQATAYAGALNDADGNNHGAITGIRRAVLDEGLTLAALASWKEQLTYGGDPRSYSTRSDLPMIVTHSEGVNDLLYFIMSHEFGHILDFANNVNSTLRCIEINGEKVCDMDPNGWGGISWTTSIKPKPEADFDKRSGLCFYWCNGNPLGREFILQVYRDLSNTDFLSTYAATNPWDDFAESMAFYMMNKNLGSSYVLDTKQGETYDTMKQLTSAKFQTKYKFVDSFIGRTDLIYP